MTSRHLTMITSPDELFEKVIVFGSSVERTLPVNKDYRAAMASSFLFRNEYPQDSSIEAFQINEVGFVRCFAADLFTKEEIESAVDLPDGRVLIPNVRTFIEDIYPEVDEEAQLGLLPIQVVVVSSEMSSSLCRTVPVVTVP